MSIPVPNLDDRSFAELVDAARTRIRQVDPEWIDLSVHDPGIVLVDVLLPGKSGLNVLATLRRHLRWRTTPFVLITGVDQLLNEARQTYLGNQHEGDGPDAVLGKPIDPAALLEVLRALKGGRTARA